MATFTIPLTTLPVGTQTFGPADIADTDSEIQVLLDRTVVNGLNSKTTATTLSIEADQSNDGGVTFFPRAAETILGGTSVWHVDGQQINTSSLWVTLAPGTARKVQAKIVVTGTSVAIAGSIITS